jgi:hypothetical protein
LKGSGDRAKPHANGWTPAADRASPDGSVLKGDGERAEGDESVAVLAEDEAEPDGSVAQPSCVRANPAEDRADPDEDVAEPFAKWRTLSRTVRLLPRSGSPELATSRVGVCWGEIRPDAGPPNHHGWPSCSAMRKLTGWE